MYQSTIFLYWHSHVNVSSYKYEWYSYIKNIIWSHPVLASAVQKRYWHIRATHQRTLKVAGAGALDVQVEAESMACSGWRKEGEREAL